MIDRGLNVTVQGYAEAVDMLKHLPDRLQRNVLNKAFRTASQVLLDQARLNASGISGNLGNAMGFITGKNKRWAITYVGPRVKGRYKDDGWFGHFTEFGTQGIGKFTGNRTQRKTDNEFFQKLYGRFKGKRARFRDDVKARPYMRPAVEATRGQVIHNVETDMVRLIHKEATRLLARGRGTQRW